LLPDSSFRVKMEDTSKLPSSLTSTVSLNTIIMATSFRILSVPAFQPLPPVSNSLTQIFPKVFSLTIQSFKKYLQSSQNILGMYQMLEIEEEQNRHAPSHHIAHILVVHIQQVRL
jgi:hypothetical protein